MSQKNKYNNWRTMSPALSDSIRRRRAEATKLHFDVVSPLLVAVLKKLMKLPELHEFRLWGSTCISLRNGHREGTNIELVAPQNYNYLSSSYEPIDFLRIDTAIDKVFDFMTSSSPTESSRTYQLGISETEYVDVSLTCVTQLDCRFEVRRGIRLASDKYLLL